MIIVGIDIAKDKHDCFICNTEGEALKEAFTVTNDLNGFNKLYRFVISCAVNDSVKMGLETTGHYSYNLLGFLLNKCPTTYVLNPLHTNLFRKSQSLRLTKTDKVDARTIASMLMFDVSLKPYSNITYHDSELK